MKKIFGVLIPLLLCSLVMANVSFASTVTLDANTSINNSTGKVNITGNISSGSDQQVTVLVKSPTGTIDYIDQTTSGVDGSYQFEYTVQSSNKGTYQVTVGGAGVDDVSETTFEYKAADSTPTELAITMTQDDKEYTNKSWTNKTVKTVIEAKNEHIEIDFLQISINGKEIEKVEGSTHKLEFDKSGIYALSIMAVDKKGNETTEERIIKISKEGLTLEPSLQQTDGIAYNSGDWTAQDVIVSMKSKNVDGAKVTEQKISFDKGETWKSYKEPVTLSEGMHTIWFQAKDEAGNHLVKKADININKNSPTLKLKGDNPLKIEVGTTYDELGAIAKDMEGKDISEDIEITREVNINKIGIYEVYYSLSDVNGSEKQVVRTVHVITPKVIQIEVGNSEIQVYGGSLVKIKGTNTSIQLPEDLPEGTTLKVESADVSVEGYKLTGEVFDFNFAYPQGQEDYTGDFNLTLGVNQDAVNLAIYYFDKQKKTLEKIGGKKEDKLITSTVKDFSIYGVFRVDEQKEETTVPKDEDNDSLLPKTATNIYNWLFLGILTIFTGFIIIMVRKRKN